MDSDTERSSTSPATFCLADAMVLLRSLKEIGFRRKSCTFRRIAPCIESMLAWPEITMNCGSMTGIWRAETRRTNSRPSPPGMRTSVMTMLIEGSLSSRANASSALSAV
jgi:hypothetical protein